MARKRVIDPDVFCGEGFTAVGHSERLLYLGLWLHADDEGRMKLSAVELKHKIFPGDTHVTSKNIDAWLGALCMVRLITVYSIGAKRFLEVRNLRDSQPLKWFTKSALPSPVTSESGEFAGQVTDVAISNGLRGEERRGEESVKEKLKENPSAPPAPDPLLFPALPAPKKRRKSEVATNPPAEVAEVFAFYASETERTPEYELTNERVIAVENLIAWAKSAERAKVGIHEIAASEWHRRNRENLLESMPFRTHKSFTGWLEKAASHGSANGTGSLSLADRVFADMGIQDREQEIPDAAPAEPTHDASEAIP